jgi:hypothetical protein
VAFACLVFLAGSLSAEFFLSRISLVMLLAGLVWTFWGMARLRTPWSWPPCSWDFWPRRR